MRTLLKYKTFLVKEAETKDKPEFVNGYIRKGAINRQGYTNVISENEFLDDLIYHNLVLDINEAGKRSFATFNGKEYKGVVAQITCGKSDHPKTVGYTSSHDVGQAVDLALLSWVGGSMMGSNRSNKYQQNKNPEFVSMANALVEQLIGLGYKLVTHDPLLKQKFKNYLALGESKTGKFVLWRGDFGKGGNHYNHIHVSNKSAAASNYITPNVDKTISTDVTQDSTEQTPQQADQITKPQTFPSNYKQTGKIYQESGDSYKYCVIGGVWYGLGGSDNPESPWENFKDWTSFEKNCKKTQELDAQYPGARTTQDIESNRQKFCSFAGDIENSKKEWYQSIKADINQIPMGSNTRSNNNPGNIRYNPEFLGCIGNDKGFCRFQTLGHGYRAILVVLTTYWTKYNLRTIRGIIKRFAPPFENNTQSYIKLVSKITGFAPDAKLEEEDLIELVPAIARQENSIQITVDEVKDLIQQSMMIGSTILGTYKFDGEVSEIYTSETTKDLTNLLIVNGFGDKREELKGIMSMNFGNILSQYAYVSPQNSKSTWYDISSDVEEYLDDTDLVNNGITLVLQNESVTSEIISSYQSIDELKFVILIQPKLEDSILDAIKTLSKSVKIYLAVDIEKLSTENEQEKIMDFVTKFKSILQDKEFNPNEYYDELEPEEPITQFKTVLNKFANELIQY